MTIQVQCSGMAIVIASAIYARPAGGELSMDEVEVQVYEAVEAGDYGDNEFKADLYARFAECLTDKTPFSQACTLIDQCIAQTRKVFPRG